MFLLGEYWSSKSYFWRLRKKVLDTRRTRNYWSFENSLEWFVIIDCNKYTVMQVLVEAFNAFCSPQSLRWMANRVSLFVFYGSIFCLRKVPNPTELALVLKQAGNFQSKISREGADIIKVFKFLMTSNWGFCNSNTTSFLRRLCSGVVCSVMLGVNFLK